MEGLKLNKSVKYKQVKDSVVDNSGMLKHFCKSYFQLARMDFIEQFKRNPTIEDAQAVYDIYVRNWKDYYIDEPKRKAANRIKGAELWRFGCQFRVDVFSALCRFLENHFKEIIGTDIHGNPIYKNCHDLCLDRKIEFLETYIVDNGLSDSFKEFIKTNLNTLKKYRRSRFNDYSHLAYSGVTDDF